MLTKDWTANDGDHLSLYFNWKNIKTEQNLVNDEVFECKY